MHPGGMRRPWKSPEIIHTIGSDSGVPHLMSQPTLYGVDSTDSFKRKIRAVIRFPDAQRTGADCGDYHLGKAATFGRDSSEIVACKLRSALPSSPQREGHRSALALPPFPSAVCLPCN